MAVMTNAFTAVVWKEEDMYVEECPEVGTVSQGYTPEEAIANLKEATELYLEEFPLPSGERSILISSPTTGGTSTFTILGFGGIVRRS